MFRNVLLTQFQSKEFSNNLTRSNVVVLFQVYSLRINDATVLYTQTHVHMTFKKPFQICVSRISHMFRLDVFVLWLVGAIHEQNSLVFSTCPLAEFSISFLFFSASTTWLQIEQFAPYQYFYNSGSCWRSTRLCHGIHWYYSCARILTQLLHRNFQERELVK